MGGFGGAESVVTGFFSFPSSGLGMRGGRSSPACRDTGSRRSSLRDLVPRQELGNQTKHYEPGPDFSVILNLMKVISAVRLFFQRSDMATHWQQVRLLPDISSESGFRWFPRSQRNCSWQCSHLLFWQCWPHNPDRIPHPDSQN